MSRRAGGTNRGTGDWGAIVPLVLTCAGWNRLTDLRATPRPPVPAKGTDSASCGAPPGMLAARTGRRSLPPQGGRQHHNRWESGRERPPSAARHVDRARSRGSLTPRCRCLRLVRQFRRGRRGWVREDVRHCWAFAVACARLVVRRRVRAACGRPSPKECGARPAAPQASALRADHAVRGCGLDPRPSTRGSGIYVMAGACDAVNRSPASRSLRSSGLVPWS